MENSFAERDVVNLYFGAEATKYIALASCTLIIYDILITLPAEIKYVWGSRWSFGRVIFHANRIWAPTMLLSYLPSLFSHRWSRMSCLSILLFYIYGTIIAMLIATSLLITRIWAMYELKRWVLVTLCLLAAMILVPSVALIQWQTQLCELAPNPAPEIISGCRFTTTPLSVIPYIAPFLFDTGLMIMTVYKVCRTSRTPFMARLMQDGAQYYGVVMTTFLFVGFSTLVPPISDAINGSGIFVAILSTMCARLVLSTRAYYDPSFALSSLEMNTISRELYFRGDEWRVHRSCESSQAALSEITTRSPSGTSPVHVT